MALKLVQSASTPTILRGQRTGGQTTGLQTSPYRLVVTKTRTGLEKNTALILRFCRTDGTLVKNGQAEQGIAKQLTLQY